MEQTPMFMVGCIIKNIPHKQLKLIVKTLMPVLYEKIHKAEMILNVIAS